MQGLRRQIDLELERSDELARIGSDAVAQFKLAPTPVLLELIQNYLRPELRNVEHLLVRYRRRKAKRYPLVKARLARQPALRLLMSDHIELLKLREAVLTARRNMLRQLGDGLAWILLGGDSRLIRAACDPRKNHFIPDEIGGLGQVAVRLQLNETEQFLALECDLTRCLGFGDLCVQRIDQLGSAPLQLEIKTSGEMRVGTMARTVIFASSLPMLEEISGLLGLETIDNDDEELDEREQTQVEDLLEHARLMSDLQLRAVGRTAPVKGRHWDCTNVVLARALQQGSAFDVPEPGLAYVAVRNSVGDDPESALASIARRLFSLGVTTEPDSFAALTTLNLASDPVLASLGLPVALWEVEKVLRAKVLTGELIFGAAFEPSIWRRVMEDAEVPWREDNGGWTIGTGKQVRPVAGGEVANLTVGIAFSALSPREVADIAKALVDSPPSEARS